MSDDLTQLEQDECALKEALSAIELRAHREAAPFIEALSKIQFSRRPVPFQTDDGRWAFYTGPIKPYQGTPAWLLHHGKQIVRIEEDAIRRSWEKPGKARRSL